MRSGGRRRGRRTGLRYPGGTTGRYLVLFEEGRTKAGVSALREVTGLEVTTASRKKDAAPEEAQALVFDALGVAVVDGPPEGLLTAGAAAEDSGPVLAVEPERVVYALEGRSADYLRGYRDAVLHLTEDAVAGASAPAIAAAADESRATWGLQAVGAVDSCHTGKGHSRRRPRHRLRPRASGFRRSADHRPILRPGPAGPGR